MSDSAVVLGPVVLDNFEVVSGITFGGAQRLIVHDLPGGRRVIDALGRQDAAIAFQGFFSGADATERARLVDELRAAGGVLSLSWDVFIYSVIIRSFSADFRCNWWIPYRVECLVLRDDAAALVEAVIDLGTSVLDDLGSAAGFSLPPSVSLTAAQTSAAVPGAAVAGTTYYNTALGGLTQANLCISGAITTTGNQIDAGTLFGPAIAPSGINSLNAMAATTGALCALTAASGYVGRALLNLTNAST
jgi:hypothetical protein